MSLPVSPGLWSPPRLATCTVLLPILPLTRALQGAWYRGPGQLLWPSLYEGTPSLCLSNLLRLWSPLPLAWEKWAGSPYHNRRHLQDLVHILQRQGHALTGWPLLVSFWYPKKKDM